jgi:NTP pyrophosphatase (non-canonical NTP hydrolase)
MADQLSVVMGEAADRAPVWFPHVWTAKGNRTIAVHHALELGSEVGEVLDVVKQWNRVDGLMADEWRAVMAPMLGRELADVLCNVAVLAKLFGLDLADELGRVIARNNSRFPLAH